MGWGKISTQALAWLENEKTAVAQAMAVEVVRPPSFHFGG